MRIFGKLVHTLRVSRIPCSSITQRRYSSLVCINGLRGLHSPRLTNLRHVQLCTTSRSVGSKSGDDEAVKKTMAMLSIIRENARQIEAFTDNMPVTQPPFPFPETSSILPNTSGTQDLEANPLTTESSTPILNEFEGEDEMVFWQDAEDLTDLQNKEAIELYDGLERAMAEQEVSRVKVHDSFDAHSWSESKNHIYASVPHSLEKTLEEMPISSMQLAFEMDMTNIKDALLLGSVSGATVRQPGNFKALKEPTHALTTCYETATSSGTRNVPLNFNALIQGIVEIDASKIPPEQLGELKVPEFNEYITAIAANICSTALKKGFPADFSRMSFSTKSGADKAGSKPRNPHVVCVREGDKGCISPGLADNPKFVAGSGGVATGGGAPKAMSSAGVCPAPAGPLTMAEIIGEFGARGLMSCKAYARALEEAAKRRAATCKPPKKLKQCKDECNPCEPKKDPCPKKEDPCAKKDPCPKKEDPCGKKDACPKKEDPCAKKDPCPPPPKPKACSAPGPPKGGNAEKACGAPKRDKSTCGSSKPPDKPKCGSEKKNPCEKSKTPQLSKCGKSKEPKCGSKKPKSKSKCKSKPPCPPPKPACPPPCPPPKPPCPPPPCPPPCPPPKPACPPPPCPPPKPPCPPPPCPPPKPACPSPCPPPCPPPKPACEAKCPEPPKEKKTKCANSQPEGATPKSTKPNCPGGAGGGSSCKKSFSTLAVVPSDNAVWRRCFSTAPFGGPRPLPFSAFRFFSSKGGKKPPSDSDKKCSKLTPNKKNNRSKPKDKSKSKWKPKDCFPSSTDECPRISCKDPPCGTKYKKDDKCPKQTVCPGTAACDPDKKENKSSPISPPNPHQTIPHRAFGTSAGSQGKCGEGPCVGGVNKEKIAKNEVIKISEACQVERIPQSIPRFSDYDVLIRTDSVALSGSDIHVFEMGDKALPGITLGHDASGVVEQVGKCILSLKPGDHVAIETGLSCGICDFCKRGAYNICPQMMYNGFLAKYQVHPADLCHKLPESVSLEDGCLASILALGCEACHKASISPTSNVLILGSCPTAIAAGLYARAVGANCVCFVCSEEHNLRAIHHHFDLDYVHYAPCMQPAEVLEGIYCCMGEQPDVAINCAMSERSMHVSVMSLAPCGTCVLAGCEAECVCFNAMDVLMKNLRLETSFRSSNMFPTALQLMECGQAPMGELIAKTYKWDRIECAFQAALHESNVGNKKVIVKCADEENHTEDTKT